MVYENRINKHVTPAANRFVAAIDKAVFSLGREATETVARAYFEQIKQAED